MTAGEGLVNVPGRVQELERNFGLIGLGSMALNSRNTWVAAGVAIVIPCQRAEQVVLDVASRSLRYTMEVVLASCMSIVPLLSSIRSTLLPSRASHLPFHAQVVIQASNFCAAVC